MLSKPHTTWQDPALIAQVLPAFERQFIIAMICSLHNVPNCDICARANVSLIFLHVNCRWGAESFNTATIRRCFISAITHLPQHASRIMRKGTALMRGPSWHWHLWVDNPWVSTLPCAFRIIVFSSDQPWHRYLTSPQWASSRWDSSTIMLLCILWTPI